VWINSGFREIDFVIEIPWLSGKPLNVFVLGEVIQKRDICLLLDILFCRRKNLLYVFIALTAQTVHKIGFSVLIPY
jgi:hypothetical protein